jgi:hypothetical protein
MCSVTEYIKRFIPPFDQMSTAVGVYKSTRTKNDKALPPAKLVHYWNLMGRRAAGKGNMVHAFAEMYDLDPINTIPMFPVEEAVVKFSKACEARFEIVGYELKCYSIKYGLLGRIDKMLKSKEDGKLTILDYKPYFDINKANKGYMLEPFNNYKYSKLNEYSLQLLSYSLMDYIELENGTKLHITKDMINKCSLVLLKDDATYEVVNCNMELQPILEEHLNDGIDYDKLH